MKKNFKIFLYSSAILTSFHLSSCDTSDPNDKSISALPSRYDLAELQAAPSDIAKIPFSLIDSDLLTFTPSVESYTENNVNLPSSEGLDDWQISPISSGQISIERQRYTYSRSTDNSATLQLSPSDRPTASRFDSAMLSLANTGEGREESLSSLLTTRKYPVNSAEIFSLSTEEKEAIREAAFSLGYIAVDIPIADAIGRGFQTVNGVVTTQIDVSNIVVLRNRLFNFQVTSTNQDIIDSSEIRGTFTVSDEYLDLALEARDGAKFYHVILARIPTFSQTLQPQPVRPEASGTFVLKLGSLTNNN